MTTTEQQPQHAQQFATVKRYLGAIPAFGDTIGDNVSKPQLAIALNIVSQLEQKHDRMHSDLSDAYESLSRHLPYNHDLLLNIRATLGIPSY